MGGRNARQAEVLMCAAVALRGRRMRRQGRGALRSRCQSSATLDCASPALGNGHTREAHAALGSARSSDGTAHGTILRLQYS
jgi:hypothetical protein